MKQASSTEKCCMSQIGGGVKEKGFWIYMAVSCEEESGWFNAIIFPSPRLLSFHHCGPLRRGHLHHSRLLRQGTTVSNGISGLNTQAKKPACQARPYRPRL